MEVQIGSENKAEEFIDNFGLQLFFVGDQLGELIDESLDVLFVLVAQLVDQHTDDLLGMGLVRIGTDDVEKDVGDSFFHEQQLVHQQSASYLNVLLVLLF